MKKLLAIVLAVIMTFGLVACSSSTQSKKSDSFKVALLNKDDTNEYFATMFDSMEAKLKEQTGLSVSRFDAKNDASAQLSQMEDVINEGVNAIVIVPMDPDTLVPGVVEANEANIPVIVLDNTITAGDHTFTYIGSDNYNLASQQAEWLIEHMEEGCRIVQLRYPPFSEPINDRYQAIQDAVNASSKKCEIINVLEVDTTQEDAQSKFEDLIQTIGNEFDAVVVWSDASLFGAIAAMEGAGIDPSTKILIGFDGEKAMLENIKLGKVSADVAQGKENIVNIVTDLVCGYRDGKDATPADATKDQGTTTITAAGVMIDSTNVDQYLK